MYRYTYAHIPMAKKREDKDETSFWKLYKEYTYSMVNTKATMEDIAKIKCT